MWFDINSVFKSILDKCQAAPLQYGKKQQYNYYKTLSLILHRCRSVQTSACMCGHTQTHTHRWYWTNQSNHNPKKVSPNYYRTAQFMYSVYSIPLGIYHLGMGGGEQRGERRTLFQACNSPFTVVIILVKSGEDGWRQLFCSVVRAHVSAFVNCSSTPITVNANISYWRAFMIPSSIFICPDIHRIVQSLQINEKGHIVTPVQVVWCTLSLPDESKSSSSLPSDQQKIVPWAWSVCILVISDFHCNTPLYNNYNNNTNNW